MDNETKFNACVQETADAFHVPLHKVNDVAREMQLETQLCMGKYVFVTELYKEMYRVCNHERCDYMLRIASDKETQDWRRLSRTHKVLRVYDSFKCGGERDRTDYTQAGRHTHRVRAFPYLQLCRHTISGGRCTVYTHLHLWH